MGNFTGDGVRGVHIELAVLLHFDSTVLIVLKERAPVKYPRSAGSSPVRMDNNILYVKERWKSEYLFYLSFSRVSRGGLLVFAQGDQAPKPVPCFSKGAFNRPDGSMSGSGERPVYVHWAPGVLYGMGSSWTMWAHSSNRTYGF